jgi:hypothetical protein
MQILQNNILKINLPAPLMFFLSASPPTSPLFAVVSVIVVASEAFCIFGGFSPAVEEETNMELLAALVPRRYW